MSTINIYTDGNGGQSAVKSVQTGKNTKQSKVVGKKTAAGAKQKVKIGSKAKSMVNQGQWVNYTNPFTASAAVASKIFPSNTKLGKFARKFKF